MGGVRPRRTRLGSSALSQELRSRADQAELDLISCADPHHEVVESLRWVRNLISASLAKPSEIALARRLSEAMG